MITDFIRILGHRTPPSLGALRAPSADMIDWASRMAPARTRVPKGLFRYASHAEANADMERWQADSMRTGIRAEPETVWDVAQLAFSVSNGTLTATGPKNVKAHALSPDGQRLLETLPPEIQKKMWNGFVQVRATVRGQKLVVVEPAQ